MNKFKYDVPEKKKIRVIIDTDAKNEADDQFAIVHALLTPKFKVQGLVATHFGERRTAESMEESYAECKKILRLMGMEEKYPVYRSAKRAMKSETEYEYSEGADFIVQEALKEDDSKLFVVVLGAITNVAAAYQRHPEIAGKFTCIWIGGGVYSNGCEEFNLSNDVVAANVIMKSDIELWQVPMNVYSMMLVTFAELQEKVYPCGELGKYLFEQLLEFRDYIAETYDWWQRDESWILGDSPVIGLMLDPHDYSYTMREAPHINEDFTYSFDGTGRKIRVYDRIDHRFILEDFFAKIKMFAAPHES